jgi:exopolysaccharide production protein ExoZ
LNEQIFAGRVDRVMTVFAKSAEEPLIARTALPDVSPAGGKPDFLNNIQVIRGLAALAVAIYHTGPVLGVRTEFQAVAVFFVVSGFIMSHIASNSSLDFAAHRIARIVPLYWFLTIVLLLLANLGLSNPMYTVVQWGRWFVSDPYQILVWISTHHGLGTADAWSAIGKSLFFIPYRNHVGDFHPLLAVGWSINMEMFYYLLFAIALAVRPAIAPLLVAAALVMLMTWNSVFGFPSEALSFLTGVFGVYFVSGIAIFYVWRWTGEARLRRMRYVLLAAAVLYAVAYFGLHVRYQTLLAHDWIAFALPPLLVFAALFLEKAGFVITWRPLIVLGNASYALYLVHPFFAETVRATGGQWPPLNVNIGYLAYAAVLIPSVSLALLLHYYFERPADKLMRRWYVAFRQMAATRRAVPAE